MEHEEILLRTARLLSRRASWVRRRALLLHALFIGLCLCLALAIWHRFEPFPISRLLEFGIAALAFCAVVALLIGMRARVDPLALLSAPIAP
jgi:hypothetical protein